MCRDIDNVAVHARWPLTTGSPKAGTTAKQISFAKHWKLVAESSEFHWKMNRAHFFPARNTQKSGTGKRDGAKKRREFTPETGNVDTPEVTASVFYMPNLITLGRDVRINAPINNRWLRAAIRLPGGRFNYILVVA